MKLWYDFANFNPRSHERSDDFILTGQYSFHHFNPRSHERSDLYSLIIPHGRINFNPRSHERSDTHLFAKHKMFSISIHAPTRGATKMISDCSTNYWISIHAPTRGATSLFGVVSDFLGISIHAPTRGATDAPIDVCCSVVISIHAPTRGATVNMGCGLKIQNFNPRSHERSDGLIGARSLLNIISIHAPTRGATVRGFIFIWIIAFQSTLPREERRFLPVKEVISVLISIHAPTRGATIFLTMSEPNLYFNPRSHERSDELL